MQECKADAYLVEYNEEANETLFIENIGNTWNFFINRQLNWNPDFNTLDNYSAKKSAEILTNGINIVLNNSIPS
jgi:hypothetical protein